jgi:hypothetical protein
MDSIEGVNVPKTRFPEKPYNRQLPKSQTSSGTELDECCEPGYQQPAKQPKE